jgi:hypothetical protein
VELTELLENGIHADFSCTLLEALRCASSKESSLLITVAYFMAFTAFIPLYAWRG